METINIIENSSNKYEVIDGKLFLIDINDDKYDLGLVLNQDNIKKERAENWWNDVKYFVTKNFLIEFINRIDRNVSEMVISGNFDTYEISCRTFNDMFDNFHYCHVFSKSELKIEQNKIDFMKYCFSMRGFDLNKILELKFPNSLIEYKPNTIVITVV